MRLDPFVAGSTWLLSVSLPVQGRHGDDGLSAGVWSRWWSQNKCAREAQLKHAEEECAAASTATPARPLEPVSPTTTRPGASALIDAAPRTSRRSPKAASPAA